MGKAEKRKKLLQRSENPKLALLIMSSLEEQGEKTIEQIMERTDGATKENVEEILKYLKGINWIGEESICSFDKNVYILKKGGRTAYRFLDRTYNT